MKCHQCPSLAMYEIGEQKLPLCLNCYSKVAHIQQQQVENLERLANYQRDEMAFIVGLPHLRELRFPARPNPVHVGEVRLNNISVTNSVVGTINTGSIGSLDQSISALVQLNQSQLANAFQELSEAILKSDDLTRNQINELIESLNTISREAATPPEIRQNTVAQSLLERAEKITSMASDISEVCQRCWPIISALFGP